MPTSIDPQPADDEIECGNCGAHIYYELTRCPKCGVNLYEPEDEIEPGSRRPSQSESSSRNKLGDRLDQFLRRLFNKPSAVDELFGASIQQAELFDDLLAKVGGDRAAAERLIEYERQQSPQGNRMTWLKHAIQHWERDNRSKGVG
jgi:hypothetical protein